MSRKIITASITKRVAKYYTRKKWCVNTELGLRSRREGMLRADVIAMNMKREVVIIEVKSSMADFRSDHKYHQYLDYCNKLYIACPAEMVEKIRPLVNKGVGIMAYDEGSLVVAKSARRKDLDPDTLTQIMMRLIFRNSEFNRFKK